MKTRKSYRYSFANQFESGGLKTTKWMRTEKRESQYVLFIKTAPKRAKRDSSYYVFPVIFNPQPPEGGFQIRMHKPPSGG